MTKYNPDKTLLASRVAAVFARQPCAHYETVNRVALDAHRFVLHALEFSARSRKGQDREDVYREMTGFADKYGARLETPCDPLGMCVGLVFAGTYTSGADNVFFVC